MLFIETSVFTKDVKALLPDENYRRFQLLAYKKSAQEDLTNEQLAILRRLVKEWLK